MRASDIIFRAYVLSNVIDSNEELQGDQSSIGLDTLNGIISNWSAATIYIPSYKTLTVPILANQPEYSVSPVITQILEGNIVDNNSVKSILTVADLKQFNAFNFQLGACRPQYVYLAPNEDNVQAGSKLFFYSTPVQNYTAILYVKYVMAEVTYSEELGDMPKFFYKPLLYQLAYELSIENSSVLDPKFEKEYDKVIRELQATVKKDYSVQNTNPFQQGRRFRPWGYYVG